MRSARRTTRKDGRRHDPATRNVGLVTRAKITAAAIRRPVRKRVQCDRRFIRGQLHADTSGGDACAGDGRGKGARRRTRQGDTSEKGRAEGMTDADAPDHPDDLPGDCSDILTETEHKRLCKCYRLEDGARGERQTKEGRNER